MAMVVQQSSHSMTNLFVFGTLFFSLSFRMMLKFKSEINYTFSVVFRTGKMSIFYFEKNKTRILSVIRSDYLYSIIRAASHKQKKMVFYYEIIKVEDNKKKEQKASEMRYTHHGYAGHRTVKH